MHFYTFSIEKPSREWWCWRIPSCSLVSMESCYNENEYKSKKIDLTLKFSPCGENAEEKERGLRRSSSSSLVVVGVANGAQWGTSLGRSCSLPAERQRRVAALSPQVLAWVAASSAVNGNNTPSSLHKPKPLPNSSQDSGLLGPTHSAEGVASNIQTSTKEENDSKASHKTTAKEISPRPADSKPENPAKKHKLGNYCSLKGDVMEILRQMPSVTTTGDDGKRIEGFLYKYRSGQVCIVCVCHGNFLTPAEFVMHAGGKKVANPMKHITVLSNSF